jgi:hypothetical protein
MCPRLQLSNLLREIIQLPATLDLGRIGNHCGGSRIRSLARQLRGLITNDVVALSGRRLPARHIGIGPVKTLVQRRIGRTYSFQPR